MSAITNATLKSLEPKGKSYQVRDTTRTGFGVQVSKTGLVSFFFRYSLNGKQIFLNLGSWGPVDLDEARRRYEDARNRVERLRKASEAARDTEDPAGTADEVENTGDEFSGWARDSVKDAAMKTHDADTVTLETAFEDYIRFRRPKPTTERDIRGALRKLEAWKRRPIASLTGKDVLDRHRKIGESSQARANSTMRWLRAVLNFASVYYENADGSPVIEVNPVARLTRLKAWFPARRKTRCLREYELRPWFEAAQGLAEVPEREPGTGRQTPKLKEGALIRDFLLFLVLTGLRRNEAAFLEWERVNWRGKTITILETKADRVHVLPLPDYLVELLKRRKAEGSGQFVFSNARGERLDNIRYALARIEKQTGIRVTPHDLRRTFSRIAENKVGTPYYTLKKLLNHSVRDDITAGYVALSTEDLRRPMEQITAYFLRAWGVVPGGEVVEFGKAKEAK